MMPLPQHAADRLVGERQADLRRSAAPLRAFRLRSRLGRLLVYVGLALSGEPVERETRGRPHATRPACGVHT